MSINVLERLLSHALECCDESVCWTTDLADNGKGYSRIRLDDTSYMYIHRLAWEAYNAEPIPPGMDVMHICDNPACFNPLHLTIGTRQENLIDCVQKGRHRWKDHTPKRKYSIYSK